MVYKIKKRESEQEITLTQLVGYKHCSMLDVYYKELWCIYVVVYTVLLKIHKLAIHSILE